MSSSFVIATSGRAEVGPRRWFRVRVHDTLVELRRAARRRSPWDEFRTTVAVCHPTPYRQHSVTKAIRYPANGFAGLIRFAAERITPEIAAHELVHAAFAVYRINVCRDVRIGRDCGDREETVAYIYGELYSQLAARLPQLTATG